MRAKDAPSRPRGPLRRAPISSVTRLLSRGRRIPARRIARRQGWGEGSQSKGKRVGERVKVGAIESEIGGGAEVGAEEVRVSNHAGENDRDCGRAGNAREGGAL